MSHTDEPATKKPPARSRNPVRKRDAILDAMHRYHREVGAVLAATAALSLNGALLSGFDTVARRATQAEVTAQKVRQGTEAAQQIAVQKNKEVRVIQLPPVQIVGRRLPPEVLMAGNEGSAAAASGATPASASAPKAAVPASLAGETTVLTRNAAQGFTAARVGLLPNAAPELEAARSSWASTQR